MNKYTYIYSALALVFSLVSCAEKITPELPEEDEYITVTSEAEAQVKAGYEGTSILPDTFFMEISSPPFSGTMTRSGMSNRYKFPAGQKLTWGETDVTKVTIKAITEPSGYTRTKGAMTVQSNQSTDENVLASDLLGAVTGDGVVINGNNINVSFKHKMSKMYIKYTASSNVTVSSIKLQNICRNGTFSYSNFNYTAGTDRGEITMYHNSSDKTAEAIFFPYTPTDAPKIQVTATIGGVPSTIDAVIATNKITSFEGGKCYIMNIMISGSSIKGAEVTVQDWNEDYSSIKVNGERVLWIGTSIPAGALPSVRSYPYLVDDAMNCEVVNNAVAGSLVIKSVAQVKNYTGAQWDSYFDNSPYSTPHLVFGGLAQTHKNIENYRNDIMTIQYPEPVEPVKPTDPAKLAEWEVAHAQWEVIHPRWEIWRRNPSNWADTHINKLKSLSYQSRIIPYINGEVDNCTTVIIDHGFNDRAAMIYEALGYGDGTPEIVEGYNFLMRLKDGNPTYEQYLEILNEWDNLTLNGNYIVDMTDVIKAIKTAKPDVRIIIGNYFTLNCPFVTREYTWTATNTELNSTTYMNYGNLICYFNEAVAGINGLDIVNVYEYMRIDEDRYWNFKYDEWKAMYDSTPQANKAGISPLTYVVQDWSKFCPDGVHPFHPDALKAIAEIYINELDGVIGSRN